MRLIKLFGLVTMSAVVAMALAGASSAMASESTALCKVHQNPCKAENQLTSIHLKTVEPTVFKNGSPFFGDIECKESLIEGVVLGLGTAPNPQKIDVSSLTWSSCVTTGVFNKGQCTFKTEELPSFDLLKTALNLGTGSGLGGVVQIICIVNGVIQLDCNYTFGGLELYAEGAGHKGAGNGMITSQAKISQLEGGLFCKNFVSLTWNALYEPSTPFYIVS